MTPGIYVVRLIDGHEFLIEFDTFYQTQMGVWQFLHKDKVIGCLVPSQLAVMYLKTSSPSPTAPTPAASATS